MSPNEPKVHRLPKEMRPKGDVMSDNANSRIKTVCDLHIVEAIYASDGPHYYLRMLDGNRIEQKDMADVLWCDVCESEAVAKVIDLGSQTSIQVEDPAARRDLLERIVASYISGLHHEDVIADDCDKVYASKLLDYLDHLAE